MNAKFQAVINSIVAELKILGGDAAEFGEAILTFLSITGPSGLALATDAATQVATKTVTPAQAVQDFKDVAAFSAAVNSAVTTIKRSDFGSTFLLNLVGDDVTIDVEAEFDRK